VPNLDYDPRNPSDLLGRPIAPGDIVAWGTTYGRSAALNVARIARINFSCLKPEYASQGRGRNGLASSASYDSADMYEPCPQAVADRYTLTLETIKTTGDVTWIKEEDGKDYREYRDGPESGWTLRAKLKTTKHVKNVVLLEPLA